MSGGEQQMLAVARALARDVKLLLLDEPYEGLAPVIVQEIERILGGIRELGMTTIIVEQNAIAALNLADRAVILDMGEVVFDGTAQEVLDNGTARGTWRSDLIRLAFRCAGEITGPQTASGWFGPTQRQWLGQLLRCRACLCHAAYRPGSC